MNRPGVVLGMGLGMALVMLGCGSDPGSAAGFRLPAGDPARGQAAFVALECHACHSVAGVDLPAPVADPPVGLDLGGIVASRRTDGELVTSIINPDHRIAMRFAGGVTQMGGHSRMGDYTETMTVRDLADIVAFLQSRYGPLPPPESL